MPPGPSPLSSTLPGNAAGGPTLPGNAAGGPTLPGNAANGPGAPPIVNAGVINPQGAAPADSNAFSSQLTHILQRPDTATLDRLNVLTGQGAPDAERTAQRDRLHFFTSADLSTLVRGGVARC